MLAAVYYFDWVVGLWLDFDWIVNPFWKVDLEYSITFLCWIWIGLTIQKIRIEQKPGFTVYILRLLRKSLKNIKPDR